MTKKLFLDIETLPPAEKDRDRILHELEKKRAKRQAATLGERLEFDPEQEFRNLALRGEFGRILTIGVLLEDNGEVKTRGAFGRERESMKFHLDEPRTLQGFWNMVNGLNLTRDLIIGHNVLDFDLPFIVKRSIIHGIKPTARIPFRRYQRQPIFDTMWEWGCWREKISLDELATALGIESSKSGGLDGSQIYEAWRSGRDEEIAAYCLRDVECVREIYYRLIIEEAPELLPGQAKNND